jgi:tRNA threonylcarbamoyl adenosine modification protein YeaZ
MTLYINTADQEKIILVLKEGDKIVAQKKFLAPRRQAEKLLPEIDKLLKKAKVKLAALKKIEVVNFGGTFTSLRIGVITANALGYALGVPVVNGQVDLPVELKAKKSVKKFKNFSVVEPLYNREPNIG